MAKTKTKAKTKKGPPSKVLAKNATRVTKKFTKAERAEHDRIAAQAEEEFSAKPVSAAKIAVAKLRTARQLGNISLAELAKRTGMAKPSLSRLENHCENVTLATLEKYAEGVGCEIDLILISINRDKPVREITSAQAKKAVKKKPTKKKKKRVAKR